MTLSFLNRLMLNLSAFCDSHPKNNVKMSEKFFNVLNSNKMNKSD
jgi:hypothetical protein